MIALRTLGTTTPAPGRRPAEVHDVVLASSSVKVRLLSLGAAIRSVETPDASGRQGNVHLSLASLADYENPNLNPHLGGSIGRYANRIAGAAFPLDGREVRLLPNEGQHQLHGGPDGFDRRVWDLLDTDDGSDGGAVRFALVSADGDQGFPGTLTAWAVYELRDDLLTVTYEAVTDARTIVNLTNHGYWNLDGAPTVGEHFVSLAAETVLPVDEAGIPGGPIQPVESTPFDLRRRTRLGTAMALAAPAGFDHCFAVRGEAGRLRPAAVLDVPASGRWMTVRTDQPGLQLYTGNHLGAPFTRHGSVSLETQRFPDTPNRPELGSALLDPGQRYRNVTELRFGTGTPPRLDELDRPAT